MKIKIKTPIILPFKTFYISRYLTIPQSFADIKSNRMKLRLLQYATFYPRTSAMVRIAKDVLGLSNAQFASVNPFDVQIIVDALAWIRKPQTEQIIPFFRCGNIEFALPPSDFIGGTAYEYAIADDFYSEWAESESHIQLLQLVATLARPYSESEKDKTGDARLPLSINPKIAEHEVTKLAKILEKADIIHIIAVLRYFEGIKTKISEYGAAAEIFAKPKENETENTPKTPQLFGWWTAFRTVAKATNKTEEQVWQMSIWRVLEIMIEEKIKADSLK